MLRKLKQLTVTKVSLVPRGSNPGAHIAIYKATPVLETDTTITIDRAHTLVDQFSASVDMLSDALKSGDVTDDAIKAQVKQKAEEFIVRHFPQELTMKEQIPGTASAEPQVEDIQKDTLPESVRKALEDAQVAVEKANATAAEALAKAAAAETRAAEETELRKRAEFSKTANETFPALPGTDEALGNLLFEARKALSDETYAKMFDILKAANAAFVEVATAKGVADSASAPTLDAGSAEAKLNAVADALMKADPKMTRPVALTKAYDAHPELYRELRTKDAQPRR